MLSAGQKKELGGDAIAELPNNTRYRINPYKKSSPGTLDPELTSSIQKLIRRKNDNRDKNRQDIEPPDLTADVELPGQLVGICPEKLLFIIGLIGWLWLVGLQNAGNLLLNRSRCLN